VFYENCIIIPVWGSIGGGGGQGSVVGVNFSTSDPKKMDTAKAPQQQPYFIDNKLEIWGARKGSQ